MIAFCKSLFGPLWLYCLHAVSRAALPETWHVALFRIRLTNWWSGCAGLALFWAPGLYYAMDPLPWAVRSVIMTTLLSFMVWRAVITADREARQAQSSQDVSAPRLR